VSTAKAATAEERGSATLLERGKRQHRVALIGCR
jgi:hypothetical protein